MAAYIVHVSQRPAVYYMEQAIKMEREGEVKMAFLQWGNAERRSIKKTGEHTAELARIDLGLGDCSEDLKEIYQVSYEDPKKSFENWLGENVTIKAISYQISFP